MDSTKQQKIKRFMGDRIMVDAVKEVLRETFMKSSGTQDVQTLASERMAINLLEAGFKELKKYSAIAEQEIKDITQIGL